jgi:hypothetical protein
MLFSMYLRFSVVFSCFLRNPDSERDLTVMILLDTLRGNGCSKSKPETGIMESSWPCTEQWDHTACPSSAFVDCLWPASSAREIMTMLPRGLEMALLENLPLKNLYMGD